MLIDSLEVSNSNLHDQVSALENALNDLSISTDSTQACMDEDNDGLCDFVMHAGFTFYFNYGIDGQESSNCLEAGGSFGGAIISSADLQGAYLNHIGLHDAVRVH